MAKKKTKIDKSKPVVNFDQSLEVVTDCDHLKKSNTDLTQYEIEKRIHIIRGEQVIIDRDVANLYGTTTSQINQQVKRNKERFPSSFRFQLTEAERDEVVTNCDNLRSLKFNPSLPYAFTEQGIAQLSTVVHSKKAIETSIKIMNAFVAMRRFVIQNLNVLMRIANLEKHQIETDEKIDAILDRIDQNSQKMLPEAIFPTGCVWDAWTYVSDLVRSAKQRIVLIDNFVDDRVLTMLTKRADGVTATSHTRYSEQFLTDLKKHNEQYPAIEFIQLHHRHHDRFLIIDDKVHSLGASVKDMGAGMCAVIEMTVTPEIILELMK